MPHDVDMLIAADPYLRNIDTDLIEHAMSSGEFETFYLRVVYIDSNIEYVAILQFYFILHVTGADIEIWGTSLAKLLDFQRDENQVKKDFRNLVIFKTSFDKSNGCREASDLFIEAYNYFGQTPVH